MTASVAAADGSQAPTTARQTLAVAMPPGFVDAVAERVAALLVERTAPPVEDGWLDVDGAAAYLACKPKRIYDLCSQRRLRFAKDGSRTLIRRSWVDAYLLEDEA